MADMLLNLERCTMARSDDAHSGGHIMYSARAVNAHAYLLEAVKCADQIQRDLDRYAGREHGLECVYCFAIAKAEGK